MVFCWRDEPDCPARYGKFMFQARVSTPEPANEGQTAYRITATGANTVWIRPSIRNHRIPVIKRPGCLMTNFGIASGSRFASRCVCRLLQVR